MNSPPRKLVERNVPSGLNSVWKLWRHCMCRNGFYPLIIAPFVTAAFILDVYVSSGCNFLHIDIGIEPVNVAWNKPTLDVGLFSHKTEDQSVSNSNLFMETFHPECNAFDSTFGIYFIDGDRTWKMAQVIAIVAGGAGCVATAIIWMMVITPLPPCFFWPGILLPAVLVELLAGTARFLLFDSQICHQDLWVPSGEAPQGQKAKSCTISRDSWVAIATSVLSLMNVLLICLRAPKRRTINQDMGMEYKDVNNDMLNLRTDTMEDSTCNSLHQDVENQHQQKKSWYPTTKETSHPTYDLEDIVQQQMKSQETEKPEQTKQIRQSKTYARNRQSKSSALPMKRKDPAAENLRSVESSFEHSSKEFQEMMGTGKKQGNDPIGSGRKQAKVIGGAEDTTSCFAEEKKSPKVQHLEDNQSVVSKMAPSDEGGCGFRSPLKAFKDNFSPRVIINKSSKWKKQDIWASPSPKAYDEDIIYNCIDNLEKQFSNSDLPR